MRHTERTEALVNPSSVAPPALEPDDDAAPDRVVHEIDDFDLEAFLAVADRFGNERFGFVVTPNVDHLIRYYEDPEFRGHYRAADYVLMDSRFVARLIRRTKGVNLPICTGSDLTAELFWRVVTRDDRIVLIGGSAAQAEELAIKYALSDLRHYDPPMGFIGDAQAVETCLRFIESASPFRFCFLAVGSPQQEALAHALRDRGRARGLALCVGASINFLTGVQKRAPRWVQQLALEWLYRLLQEPRRLARRYLIRGLRIFVQLRRADVVLRKAPAR
jgi:exopolysaccharide biosynthesis WecB/TagA/CpsF family protein